MAENSSESSRVSGRQIALGVLAGFVLILVGLYVWNYTAHRGHVPRGTTVGGVSIGTMEPTAAEEKLRAELGSVNENPVSVTAGEKKAEFVPEHAGFTINWKGTVDSAGLESANPFTMLKEFFTTKEISAIAEVDDAALNNEAQRLDEELHVNPVDGAVAIENGKTKVTDPILGQNVDRQVIAQQLKNNWLNPQGVTLKPEVLQPAVNQEVIDETVKGPAAQALSGPVVLHGRNHVDGTIPVERMGEVVTFEVVDEKLQPKVNTEKAQEILSEKLKTTEIKGKNAKVNSDGSITEHVDGSVIDWEKALNGLSDRIIGKEKREWDAPYKDDPAEFTTEQAKNAHFDDVVGEFTTSGYSSASGYNISVIAKQINGVIVNPGETFSVNDFTGPRGTAQGYVESGIIENGRAATGVGGGISQFATTLYNAAYFAGMEDVTHQAHSYYISRYPAGREATLFDGVIDLAFKNTSPYPVRIDSSMGDGSVTVRLMGVKTYDVESISGGRWAPTEPKVQEISGDDCIPSSGIPGFTTSDTRVIRDLKGNELSRETQTTVYQPQPIVKCI